MRPTFGLENVSISARDIDLRRCCRTIKTHSNALLLTQHKSVHSQFRCVSIIHTEDDILIEENHNRPVVFFAVHYRVVCK